MGGSGGGVFTNTENPGDLARRIQHNEAQTHDQGYETDVNQLLGECLKVFNDRDTHATREVLEKVTEVLGDEIGETVDLKFGGSVSRHTYVDGLSDTDALVALHSSDVGHESPDNLKNRFAERLADQFGDSNVKTGALAVTLTIDNKEVQLLPALQDNEGLRIAAPDGRSWSRINPRAFSEKLTQANKSQDGKLVPTIKLAKAIMSTLPEQQRLTGYHLESLAIEAFRNYDGHRTYKAMVKHLFKQAEVLVRTPIVDQTGQSLHVDEHLGKTGSPQRQLVSHALQRVSRKLQNADASRNIEAWSEMVATN